jgi:hypothetical protein
VAAVNDVSATLALLRGMLPEYEPTTFTPTAASAKAPYPDGF